MFGDFIKRQLEKRKWSFSGVIYAPYIPVLSTKTISREEISKKRDMFKCPVCLSKGGMDFADEMSKAILASIDFDYKHSERIFELRFKCLYCESVWKDSFRIDCIKRDVTFVPTKPAKHIEVDVKASISRSGVTGYSGVVGYAGTACHSGDAEIKDKYYKKISLDCASLVDKLIRDEVKSIAGEDDVVDKEKR